MRSTSTSLTQELALSLLVLRVFTDNSDAALSLNDFAFFTNWFNWWSNLHCKSLLSDKFGCNYITTIYINARNFL